MLAIRLFFILYPILCRNIFILSQFSPQCSRIVCRNDGRSEHPIASRLKRLIVQSRTQFFFDHPMFSYVDNFDIQLHATKTE